MRVISPGGWVYGYFRRLLLAIQGWLIKSMCMLTRAEPVLASTASLPRGLKCCSFCKEGMFFLQGENGCIFCKGRTMYFLPGGRKYQRTPFVLWALSVRINGIRWQGDNINCSALKRNLLNRKNLPIACHSERKRRISQSVANFLKLD